MTTPLKQKLAPIFEKVGHENVWRPIHDRDGALVHRGGGKFDNILPETLDAVELAGKSVADLGSNFGYYSFEARRRGAARVTGFDLDPDLARGASILRDHYGITDVEFVVADFVKEDLGRTFDLVLMIDFVGAGLIRSGKAARCLAAASRLSRSEMLLTIHADYRLKKLRMTKTELDAMFGPGYVRDNHFYFGKYVLDFFAGEWEGRFLPHSACEEHNLKCPVHFRRKNPLS